jgi:hypothetical protein
MTAADNVCRLCGPCIPPLGMCLHGAHFCDPGATVCRCGKTPAPAHVQVPKVREIRIPGITEAHAAVLSSLYGTGAFISRARLAQLGFSIPCDVQLAPGEVAVFCGAAPVPHLQYTPAEAATETEREQAELERWLDSRRGLSPQSQLRAAAALRVQAGVPQERAAADLEADMRALNAGPVAPARGRTRVLDV